jgi:FkbM family methyltransferase
MPAEEPEPAAGEFARLAVPGTSDVEICLPDANDPIAHELRAGVYELPAAARLVLDLLTPGCRFLDLGAHLGTVALPAAARHARVLAIEASPRNARCLTASARRNGFRDVAVYNVAVGDRNGTVRFREEGPYGRVTNDDDAGTVEVPMRRAADIVTEHDWDRVDVVKIDVEGFELAVLDGLRPLLEGPAPPPVVFEANRHVLAPRGIAPADLVVAFARLGYETYFVTGGALIAGGPDAFQPETVADYLALAPGRPVPWPVREPPTVEELAQRIALEARSPVWPARAALAGALATAPRVLLGRREVELALEALVLDRDDSVAKAAEWWPAWRQARAARHGPVAAIADGWRALADSSAALSAALRR